MYKLEIFCTPEQQERVLSTLHESGVDRIGNYDHCWAIGQLPGLTERLMDLRLCLGAKEKLKITRY
nr:hypothetical protein [Vibrio chagasii]